MCKKVIYLVCFVLVLGLSTGVANAHPKPAGWWKFDGDAFDSSGNGLNGTLMGNPAPVFAAGMFDQALDTTEPGGPGYVEITGYKGILGPNPFSITAWINTSDVEGTIMGWGSTDGGVTRVEFRINEDRLRCESSGNVQGDTTLPNNEWFHVAVTVKANAIIDDPDVTLYLNGQVNNRTSTGSANPLQMAAGYDVTIARRHTSGRWLDALIDDVRIYDIELTQTEIKEAMAGIGPISTKASYSHPDSQTTDVPRDVTLSWTPGVFANTHDVYFGTVFDDVNNASRTNPRGVLVSQNQVPDSYSPAQILQWEQTYYWRVDEVNAPPDFTIFKGDVWSFTVEPFAYPIENIIATASSQFNENSGPQNTINGSGLDDNDLHSIEETGIWLSGMGAPQPTWIQYEFDRIYKLQQMWVWNHNTAIESTLGFGIKDATIEYSTDGTNWATLGTTHEFARAPGTPGYAHNTTIDLSDVVAKYVKITANSNWGGILPQYGLGEVRFYYVPVVAREPNPASGATDMNVDNVTLSWRAGREAAKHNVYVSTDEQAVINGTAPVATVTTSSYGPLSLNLGVTNYWRVDEVNEAELPTTWASNIWSFTTIDHIVVNNFESYNDLDTTDPKSNRIFNAWIDGYGTTTNGSIVGYENPPFAEKTIVHGGGQSMPLSYNNSGTARYSEATLTLSSQRDWTIKNVGALSLWFKGNPAGFVEGPAGTYTMAASGVDIWGTADQFRFAWKQLTGDGSIIARVESVELVPGSNDWVKAGVMIRETLEPGSKFAAVYMTPTRPDGTPTRGCRYQARTSTGGSATSDSSVATAAQQALIVPYWVKMERVGNKFNAYYSADGVSWQAMIWNPQTISMSANVYIGLALTSHSAGVTAKAVFFNVTTTGAVTGVFTEQVIGAAAMPTNGPASMYVALASGGTPAVIYHDNPSASQIGNWTEWSINLQSFAAKGVNLTRVNTIAVGFGDKTNPLPGGSGTMYFDDIRLYPQR